MLVWKTRSAVALIEQILGGRDRSQPVAWRRCNKDAKVPRDNRRRQQTDKSTARLRAGCDSAILSDEGPFATAGAGHRLNDSSGSTSSRIRARMAARSANLKLTESPSRIVGQHPSSSKDSGCFESRRALQNQA